MAESVNHESSAVQLHRQLVSNLCRVCGCDAAKPGHDKNTFATELAILGIFVEEDHPDIHPAKICKRHKHILLNMAYGYKISFKITPVTFSNHTEDCKMCFPSTAGRGRPAKKRKHSATKFTASVGPTTPDVPAPDTSTPDFPNQDGAQNLHIAKLLDDVSSLNQIDKSQFLSLLVNELTVADKVHLAAELGSSVQSDVHRDALAISQQYKDKTALSSYNLPLWIQGRNEVVTSFLCGSTKYSGNTFLFARTLEQIYKLRCPNLVSPFAFLTNIVLYTSTGSRFVTDILGHSGPAGSYKTIQTWLRDQSQEALFVEKGDVINVFDNEQVIGRKTQIRPGQTAPISIITNKGYINLNPEGKLQEDCLLGPPVLSVADQPEFLELVKQIQYNKLPCFYELEQAHDHQLYRFIEQAIESVVGGHTDQTTDIIDQTVADQRRDRDTVVCAVCGQRNQKNKQICIGCRQRDGIKAAKEKKKGSTDPGPKPTVSKSIQLQFDTDEQETTIEERYGHVPTGHQGKRHLSLTEPVFCNPNSLDSVRKVLRQIGEENGIDRYGGNSRYWTFVCCDGLPFLLVKKLKEQACVCELCMESFLTSDSYHKHHQSIHESSPEKYYFEFDWVYLKIGHGHYEMNLIRSFFELAWTPLLERFCEVMGFDTLASKAFAMKAKDHHKSWSLLLAFHVATLQELVTPYVRATPRDKLSPIDCVKYCKEHYTNPNAKFTMDLIFTYTQGIINFRMGVRRNNALLVRSAKYMTKGLFSGRNHPKYLEIELYDSLQYYTMPEEVRDLYDNFMSVTTSGHPSLGEDYDFILEEKNRLVKQLVPSGGIPTEKNWLAAVRNQDRLSQLRESTIADLGIPISNGCPRPLNLDEAVLAWRCTVRETEYFKHQGSHVSINGQALDHDLINFVELAIRRRMYYIDTRILGKEDTQYNMRHSVYVTPEEREVANKLENRTKQDLLQSIGVKIQAIDRPRDRLYHEQKLRLVKDAKKDIILSLYQEVDSYLACHHSTV